MKPHVCQESKTCCCSVVGIEPDEECPMHGAGPWPPRCDICGRFMKRFMESAGVEWTPIESPPPAPPTGFFHWVGEKFKKLFI